MKDFTSNIDDDDILASRENRNSMMNRPDIDPGMEDDEEDNWNNIGGSDSESDSWSGSFGSRNPFEEDNPFGGPASMGPRSFGGPRGFSQQYGNPMDMQQNQNNVELPEDKFFGAVAKVGKGSFNFLKEIIESFKSFNLVKRKDFGRNVIISSLLLVVIAGILFLLKVPNTSSLVIGSFLSTGVGCIVFLPTFGKLKELEEKGELDGVLNSNSLDMPDSRDIENSEEEINLWDDDEDDKEIEVEVPSFTDFESSNVNEEDDSEPVFTEGTGFNYDLEIEEPVKTPEEVLSNLVEDTSMMTRQYLYDNMTNVLESKTRNFADVVLLDEDSKEFLAFCAMFEKATKIVSGKENSEVPEITRIEDKLFYTVIITNRPNWLNSDGKTKNFLQEIINMCSFDKKTLLNNPDVTGSYHSVGDEIYFKIFKGETAMVTIKDTYSAVKDEVLDLKNKFPVVFGLNENGVPVFTDFNKMYSLLISGAPRTGKSWCVKAILGQLMMFKRPSELQFYLMDPKFKTSDFFTLETTHVREFISDKDRILEVLRYLVNDEAKRREDIFFEAGGFKNMEDFCAANPNSNLPYIYVVIDEIMTITSSLKGDENAEFMEYLKQFVSRLPGYGIRLIMVPHVIKNSVIGKTITDLIPNRIVVKGDAESIEAVVKVKQKEFPYTLAHNGDMAGRLGDEKPTFIHSAVISSTNAGYDKFFDFLTNFWLKIEPESYKGSKLESDIKKGYKREKDFPILDTIDKEKELSGLLVIPSEKFSNEETDKLTETVDAVKEEKKKRKLKKDSTM